MGDEERRARSEPLPRAEDEPTVDLWPTAGRALGLGRTATYAAARAGEIPGLMRIGALYRVATAELRRALGLDQEDRDARTDQTDDQEGEGDAAERT